MKRRSGSGRCGNYWGSWAEGVEIRPPFYCDDGSRIFVGARSFANFGLVALDVARITIGEDVQMGP